MAQGSAGHPAWENHEIHSLGRHRQARASAATIGRDGKAGDWRTLTGSRGEPRVCFRSPVLGSGIERFEIETRERIRTRRSVKVALQ